ncbi:MAG: tetratricopeptide repeat protein [Thermaerobacter sp.]|nr:tetratricopeptide repeat protein [Thermaerobacter sp.]
MTRRHTAGVAAAAALLQAGQADAARRQLALLVAEAPTDGEAWYWWAAAQDAVGRESTAIAAYHEALRRGTTHETEAHAFLASSLEKTWRAGEALAHIERAVAVQPDHALFLTILGNVCAALGLRERAEDAYRRAMAADPALGLAWHQWGQWQGTAGRLAEAAQAFDRAWALGYRG